jgi:hypothetical protein
LRTRSRALDGLFDSGHDEISRPNRDRRALVLDPGTGEEVRY